MLTSSYKSCYILFRPEYSLLGPFLKNYKFIIFIKTNEFPKNNLKNVLYKQYLVHYFDVAFQDLFVLLNRRRVCGF